MIGVRAGIAIWDIRRGVFKADHSYELWARDLNNGNEIRVGGDLTKQNVNNFKKNLGYKKIEIKEV